MPARGQPEEVQMPDHVYRIIEVAGSSERSIDDAIRSAVARAARTLRQVGWFEVVQTRGHVEDGKVAHFQVVLKVGFTLEDSASD
jgi:dodecin